MSRWFRHYAGTMSDPKFGGAARVCKRSRAEVLFVWGCLLESCAEYNSEVYSFDADAMADLLDIESVEAQSIHDALVQKGLLDGGKIVSWGRRQFTSDDSTKRVRAHRERQKTATPNDGNADETLQTRAVTPPYTETDSEEDREASLPAAPSATVVAITEARPPKAKPAKPWLDPEFIAAWDLCTPEMRRRSHSREITFGHWKRQAAIAGPGALTPALEAYLRQDPDVKRTGGPGFHIWLKDGTWEHWTEDAASAAGGVTSINVAKRREENRRLYGAAE